MARHAEPALDLGLRNARLVGFHDRRFQFGAFQDYLCPEVTAMEAVGMGDLPHVEEERAVRQGLARAGASEMPTELPSGLATQLGRTWRDGAELSGGQWQKLALGRGLMRATPLARARRADLRTRRPD